MLVMTGAPVALIPALSVCHDADGAPLVVTVTLWSGWLEWTYTSKSLYSELYEAVTVHEAVGAELLAGGELAAGGEVGAVVPSCWPKVIQLLAMACWAAAKVIRPSHTAAFAASSTASLGFGDAPASGHRFSGLVGEPPSSSGIR